MSININSPSNDNDLCSDSWLGSHPSEGENVSKGQFFELVLTVVKIVILAIEALFLIR